MSDFLSLPAFSFDTVGMTSKMETAQNSLKSEKIVQAEGNSLQLKETCAEFESLFISFLLKEMRATIPKTGLMSGGRAEEIYTSMLDSEIAKEIASQRGIGLSALMLDRLESQTVNGRKNNFEKKLDEKA